MDSTVIKNAMTVDVEEYFQVSAFDRIVSRESWTVRESRVARNVDVVLGLLEEAGVRATFFTLGWIAERHPDLIRRIAAEGHEIASHGYDHRRVTALTRALFTEDVKRSKGILEDVTGQEVHGYRAPSFSIGADNQWAFEVLSETGYRYSSSVYPIKHDHYGMPSASRSPFSPLNGHGLIEVPMTTARVAGRNVPASGGGYFRLLPYAVSRNLLQRVNRDEGRACIFYFHPWELDPEQPRPVGLDIRTRFRHYLNLERTHDRLRQLLRDFSWDRVDQVFMGQSVPRLNGHRRDWPVGSATEILQGERTDAGTRADAY